MLSEEEKKAIKMIEIIVDECKLENKRKGYEGTYYDGDTPIPYKEYEIILNLITKLQKENEEKDKRIKLFEHECRKFKAFCKRVRKDGHNIDLFNQGQEQKCNQFLNLISGELHWDYEGKYFDETDKEIQKLAKEKGENNDNN